MALHTIREVTVFSIANPEHAIASLRLAGPLTAAGIKINWRMPHQDYDANLLAGSDVVIIQRDFPRFVDRYVQIHSDAYSRNIPVIFEIDDLLWGLPEDHPDRETRHYTDALLPMFFAAWAADGITVASEGIQRYLSWLNPEIFVLPNYLDSELWSLKAPEPSQGDSLMIGYMGGDSHQPDLEMVEKPLLRLLERFQGQVKFKTWGLKPSPALLAHPSVEWVELSPGDYSGFARYFGQQKFDIYISPLKDSQFNRCKSSIKILEYTSLGITGVSSDIPPYRKVVEPGATGLLADTNENWEKQLESLVINPALRLELAQRAQESVIKDWLMKDHADQWMQVYCNLATSYEQRQDVPKILQMMNNIMTQSLEHQASLVRKLKDQEVIIAHYQKGVRWQAIQALKTIYRRLFISSGKGDSMEILDES
jgi:glycosyltransferase involved in cell wall biosynthesis